MSKHLVKVKMFREGSVMPTKSTSLSAGYDIHAWIEHQGNLIIEAWHSAIIKTGLNIRLGDGYKACIYSRSGLSAKHNIFVLNAPGLIDPDYSGDGPDFEIKVVLFNASDSNYVLKHGDRCAQLVIEKICDVSLEEDFNDSEQIGERVGGLGSTGIEAIVS